MSAIIDIHTHYLAIARFPEIAGIEGLVPHATESGAPRTTIQGVSSIRLPAPPSGSSACSGGFAMART